MEDGRKDAWGKLLAGRLYEKGRSWVRKLVLLKLGSNLMQVFTIKVPHADGTGSLVLFTFRMKVILFALTVISRLPEL